MSGMINGLIANIQGFIASIPWASFAPLIGVGLLVMCIFILLNEHR